MEVLKTLKVKNLNGTFEQITPIGTETEYVSRKWVNPDSGNTEEITLEQSLSLIEQDIDRINGDAETVGSIDAKINQAKEDLIGEASEVYNTFEKVQNQVEKNIKGEGLVEGDEENLYNTLYKVNNKLNQLDGSVSINGSIKQQISAAINDLKGNASTAMDTLEEIEILFNSIKSNEEEGLDSLSELASVYTQLKTLIGELPDQYKNSTVIQYIQALVNSENNRAVTVENSIKADISKYSNRLGTTESKIATLETLTGNHTTKITALETLTGKHTTQINSLSGTVTTQIGSLNDTVSNHTTQIGSLNDTVSKHATQINNQATQISNLNNSQKAYIVETTTGPSDEITFILHWQNNILNISLSGILEQLWVSGQNYVTLGTLSDYNITLRPSYTIRKYIIINRYKIGILRITTSGDIALGYIFDIGGSTEESLTAEDNIRIDEVFFLGAGAESNTTTEEGA